MTPEELLIPRYKVIADYPDSPFAIGNVIELPVKDEKGVFWTDRIDIDDTHQGTFSYVFFADYHHLFRLMNWAEERKPEELHYLKANKRFGTMQQGEIIRAESLWDCGVAYTIGGLVHTIVGEMFTPVSEAEYLQQNTIPPPYQKQKH